MKKISLLLAGLMLTALMVNARQKADESPLALHLYPQDQRVQEGDEAIWYLTAAGGEPLEYQWKLNGRPVDGAKTNTLRIASADLSKQGSYTCSIKNTFGETHTEPVTLTVVSKQPLSTSQKLNLPKGPTGSSAQSAPASQP